MIPDLMIPDVLGLRSPAARRAGAARATICSLWAAIATKFASHCVLRSLRSGFLGRRSSRLDESAQHFGDAPGLGDAAARGEGGLGIKDLADRADAGLGEMRFETDEKMPCRLALARKDLKH